MGTRVDDSGAWSQGKGRQGDSVGPVGTWGPRQAGMDRKILEMLTSCPSFPLYSQGKAGEPGLPGPEGARGPPVSALCVCV